MQTCWSMHHLQTIPIHTPPTFPHFELRYRYDETVAAGICTNLENNSDQIVPTWKTTHIKFRKPHKIEVLKFTLFCTTGIATLGKAPLWSYQNWSGHTMAYTRASQIENSNMYHECCFCSGRAMMGVVRKYKLWAMQRHYTNRSVDYTQLISKWKLSLKSCKILK